MCIHRRASALQRALIGAALTNVPASALPASLQPFYPTVQTIAGSAVSGYTDGFGTATASAIALK